MALKKAECCCFLSHSKYDGKMQSVPKRWIVECVFTHDFLLMDTNVNNEIVTDAKSGCYKTQCQKDTF